MSNLKQFKRENNNDWFMYRKDERNTNMEHQQTTTTDSELQALALGQVHIHTETGRVKHVSGIPTP